MYRVVSVSLGSPLRDHRTLIKIGGERVQLERIGCAGDVRRAAEAIRSLDGRVDAIGLGGVNLALRLGREAYPLPEGEFLQKQALRTPVCDGSSWKRVAEPLSLHLIARKTGLFQGRVSLVSSVLDRFPLAQALEQAGSRVLVGDAFYALRLPVIFPSVRAFRPFVKAFVPLLRRIPIRYLYGSDTSEFRECPGVFFKGIDILAGDFHYIKVRIPTSLSDKIIVASTMTEGEMKELYRRGAALVLSLTPPAGGRVYGANAWEAITRALTGRSSGELDPRDCQQVLSLAGKGVA